VTLSSSSQELNCRFTQYLADNPFVISPAYAGIGDNFRVRLNGLTQWVGIKELRKTNPCMLILGLQIDRVWGFQFTMIKWIYRQTGAKVSLHTIF
jgi:hypothetical protein